MFIDDRPQLLVLLWCIKDPGCAQMQMVNCQLRNCYQEACSSNYGLIAFVHLSSR
uniref:Uncharacterized protein n=1 Tax=Anguilla anguilla TaxID=7936 RepID=A0A0E9X259_ANGAN